MSACGVLVVLAGGGHEVPSLAIALIVGGALATAQALWYFSPAQRVKRRLRAALPWQIGELPEGVLGRVIGRARPLDETLAAPLSGRPCVHHAVTVSRARGKNWEVIIREVRGVPFLVEDGSGRAVVEPADAELALTEDHAAGAEAFAADRPHALALLARHGYRLDDLQGARLVAREAVIAVDEQVAVLGAGVREPDPDAPPAPAYRGPTPTRLRIARSRRFPLLLSDHPSTTRPRPSDTAPRT